MFTREEALLVWDDLIAEKDAFLSGFGEVVFSRQKNISTYLSGDPSDFGYFVRAYNHCFTKEMFAAYDKVCQKHNCTYRIENAPMVIIFYKKRENY